MFAVLSKNTLLLGGFVMAVLVGEIHSQTVNGYLQDLVAAERAFAAETVKVGFREGFIKYFADDGIGFGPHPERTKEVLQKRPAETGPRTLIFNWQPMFGDISQAGDLGYTTGPVLFTDLGPNSKPPRHGIYFSVWQKQADGTWKVAIDMGVDTPEAVAPIDTGFTAANVFQIGQKGKLSELSEQKLRTLDESLTRYISEHGMAKAYANLFERRQFRIHRKSRMPMTNEDRIMAVMISADSFEFLGGKISKSNDFAFTYGKYFSATGGSEAETGYYVHVWRRDESGVFKMVVDVQNPLPKQ